MTDHSKIIATLKLANNGYTFARNMSSEQIAQAEAAVKDGVVKVKRDYNSATWKDDETKYYVTGMKTTYVAWHPAYNNGKGRIVSQVRLDAGMYHGNVLGEMGMRNRDLALCDAGENPIERGNRIRNSEIKEYDTF